MSAKKPDTETTHESQTWCQYCAFPVTLFGCAPGCYAPLWAKLNGLTFHCYDCTWELHCHVSSEGVWRCPSPDEMYAYEGRPRMKRA